MRRAQLCKYAYKAPSQIAGAGTGVYAKRDIPAGVIIGRYNGYNKKLEDVDYNEMVYAADIGDNKVRIGSGISAIINDTVILRKLTPIETHYAQTYGIFPRHNGLEHNTQFIRTQLSADKSPDIYIQTILPIKKGDELFIDYGKQYWQAVFSNQGLWSDKAAPIASG